MILANGRHKPINALGQLHTHQWKWLNPLHLQSVHDAFSCAVSERTKSTLACVSNSLTQTEPANRQH